MAPKLCLAVLIAFLRLVPAAGEGGWQPQSKSVRSETGPAAQPEQLATEIRKFMEAQPPLPLPNRQPGNARGMFELSVNLARQMGIKQPELFALETTAEVVRRDRGFVVALPYFQELLNTYVRQGDRDRFKARLVDITGSKETAENLMSTLQLATAQKTQQEGVAPLVKYSNAVSKTKALGDPIELRGTIENRNPFAIARVEVSFLHACTGESRKVVLFEHATVPPKSTKDWQVTVTFNQGHFPDALVTILGGWERAK